MNFNQKVSDYISKASKEQMATLETLRQLIHENVEDVLEEIKWNMPVFGKTKDFAYLRFSKKHITLGFYYIDKLKDPDNLLEGEGNTLKHIKITKLDNIQKQQIKKWLKQITE